MLSSNWAALQSSKAPALPTKKRKRAPSISSSTTTTSFATSTSTSTTPSTTTDSTAVDLPLTSVVAMDCEMVGVGDRGKVSILARCSIVNMEGQVLLDCYVKPTARVVDFRTHVSGIRPSDISGPHALNIRDVRTKVTDIINNRILVGHGLGNDLECLGLTHPRLLMRDTAHYKTLCPRGVRSLKKLCQSELGLEIQAGAHDSVADARSALALYRKYRKSWELLMRKISKKVKT